MASSRFGLAPPGEVSCTGTSLTISRTHTPQACSLRYIVTQDLLPKADRYSGGHRVQARRQRQQRSNSCHMVEAAELKVQACRLQTKPQLSLPPLPPWWTVSTERLCASPPASPLGFANVVLKAYPRKVAARLGSYVAEVQTPCECGL